MGEKIKCIPREWNNIVVISHRTETPKELKTILNEYSKSLFSYRWYHKISIVKDKERLSKEQKSVFHGIECYGCIAVYIREASRQLNVGLKETQEVFEKSF